MNNFYIIYRRTCRNSRRANNSYVENRSKRKMKKEALTDADRNAYIYT